MIDKIGAVIIKDSKLLAAREQGKGIFFIPGGKREGSESDDEALRREVMEELGTGIKSSSFYRTFTARASTQDDDVTVNAYFCETENEPKPSGEIEELIWVSRDNYNEINIGNVLKLMIPALIEDGYL
jgi:8-oxo-dGTP diphosphatase